MSSPTIVVTCATGEIGSGTAMLLAKDYNLLLVGRNKDKLCALKEQLRKIFPHSYKKCQLDYSDPLSLESFSLKVANRKISGIVIITPRPQLDLLADSKIWNDTLQSCFTGPYEVMNRALASMAEQSKIVVISGITSVQVNAEYGATSVIRGMWSHFTKALSHKVGPKGIYVNTVSPGIVMTSHHKVRIQKKAEETGRSYEEQYSIEVKDTPLKRYASVEDVAKAIRYLLSDESNHITGINLLVDGGITRAIH